MTAKQRKRLLMAVAGVFILALIIYALLPDPARVTVATVREETLVVDVEAEGVTTLRQRYEISAPATAWLRRIELEPGDPVHTGMPLAVLEAPPAPALDPRSRAEAEARLQAARAVRDEATAREQAAAVEAERTAVQAERIETLFSEGSATADEREQARTAARAAAADLEAARAAIVQARSEAEAAEAALYGPGGLTGNRPVLATLTSPIAGEVIDVMQTSAGLVQAGTLLMTVADPNYLNVELDVLSTDVVGISSGTRVVLTEWGGDPLEAIVQRVEPEGFTEVSSLGVEEQRVPVLAEITSPVSGWASLGAGYRVIATFIVHEIPQAIVVPSSAVFRTNTDWAVFVVEDDVALLREVVTGHRDGLSVQIESGLSAGELVITQPEDIQDGQRVTYDPEDE